MLFGDRNEIAIEIQPLFPSWERGYLPERSAWGQLTVWAGGENLCRNIVEGTDHVREGVNVPLAPLADWLVRSWTFLKFEERPQDFPPAFSPGETLKRWGFSSPPPTSTEDQWVDLREQWWSRHFVHAGAEGSQLPNFSLVRLGDWLSIDWMPARFAGSRSPRFLSQEGHFLSRWADAEHAIGEFVITIASWLRREGLGEVYDWVAGEQPPWETDPRFLAALEAYTGRPVDSLFTWTGTSSEPELRGKLGLRADTNDPAGCVITQVLRDLPGRLPRELGEELIRLDAATRGKGGIDPNLRRVARDAVSAAQVPEDSGHLAAREVRSRLNLDGQPVDNLDRLAERIGVQVRDSAVESAGERMLAGARADGGAVVVINKTPRTAVSWGRRFEVARGLGQLLIGSYRDNALGAASSAFSQTWLRRCSGAFAAEFLLPTSGLSDRGLDSLDRAAEPGRFQALMTEYGVGARTAAFQLWNHGLLSSAQMRDDLIDKYASSAGSK